MKSTKMKFLFPPGPFLTLAATLQGPTAGRERERERERERAAEQHGVRAGQLRFFAQRNRFSLLCWLSPMNKIGAQSLKKSVAKNIVLEKLLIRPRPGPFLILAVTLQGPTSCFDLE